MSRRGDPHGLLLADRALAFRRVILRLVERKFLQIAATTVIDECRWPTDEMNGTEYQHEYVTRLALPLNDPKQNLRQAGDSEDRGRQDDDGASRLADREYRTHAAEHTLGEICVSLV